MDGDNEIWNLKEDNKRRTDMDIQDLYERVYDGHEGRLLRPTAFIAQADFFTALCAMLGERMGVRKG